MVLDTFSSYCFYLYYLESLMFAFTEPVFIEWLLHARTGQGMQWRAKQIKTSPSWILNASFMEENPRLEVGRIYSADVVEFFLGPGKICHPIGLTIFLDTCFLGGALSLLWDVRLDKRESPAKPLSSAFPCSSFSGAKICVWILFVLLWHDQFCTL